MNLQAPVEPHFLWSSGQGPIFSNLLHSQLEILCLPYIPVTVPLINLLTGSTVTRVPFIVITAYIYSYLGHQSKVGMPEEPQRSNYDVLHVLATLEKLKYTHGRIVDKHYVH